MTSQQEFELYRWCMFRWRLAIALTVMAVPLPVVAALLTKEISFIIVAAVVSFLVSGYSGGQFGTFGTLRSYLRSGDYRKRQWALERLFNMRGLRRE